MKFTTQIFPDVSAFLTSAETPARCGLSNSSEGGESSWAGETRAGAFNLARTGWSARPDISGMAKDFAAASDHPAHSTVHAVSGAVVDMGEYLAGMPECMIDFLPEPSPRIVRLGFNIWTPAQASAYQFQLRGAIVTALVDALQASGRAVEIVVYAHGHNRGESHFHLAAFTLKQSSQPLDADALAFWCCHPAALRRMMFAQWEQMPRADRQSMGFYSGGGYGKYASLCPEAAEVLKLDIDLHALPASHADAVRTFEKTVESYT